MASKSWTRLIRFIARDTKTYYGDAILPTGVSDLSQAKRAAVITGDIFGEHSVSSQVLDVAQLLSPLPRTSVPTLRCIGLNYALHAKESNMPLPTYPSLFFKPSTSLSGPIDPIPIPPLAQKHHPPTPKLDYECELVIIIGRDGTNISESDALSYVLGYSVGNDFSQRHLQLSTEFGSGGQWSHGKGFDGWAPFGPGIVATSVLGDAGALKITSRVNGETRQSSSTSDMVFGVRRIVSILSQGVTLRRGDLVFTGTPQGVAMGMSPKGWVRDGDEVEVELEGVGVCRNRVVFERVEPKL